MNITLATNSLLPADKEGGPAYSNFYLAKALVEAGANVRVVTTDRNGLDRLDVETDSWCSVEGMPVFYARSRSGAWLYCSTYADAARYAVERSDVCIMSGLFWNYTGLAAWRACTRFDVPYITMPRGLLSPWALGHKGVKKAVYWRLVARRIVRGSSALIALADQERRELDEMSVDVPLHVVPNGAYLAEGEGGAGRADARLLARIGAERYVLFLGRIHKKKGLDILIPAFSEVARQDPGVLLVIAGSVDPAYSATFRSLLEASDVRSRIVLAGNVTGPTKAALLRRAALFVLTSYSEGLPMAALEALAAGLPVVLTPECNLPEIKVADAGVEVARDPHAVAHAISAILEDEPRRRRLAGNAAGLAREVFSWASVGRRVLGICGEVRRAAPSNAPA